MPPHRGSSRAASPPSYSTAVIFRPSLPARLDVVAMRAPIAATPATDTALTCPPGNHAVAFALV